MDSTQGEWRENFPRNEKDDIAYVRHEYFTNGRDVVPA